MKLYVARHGKTVWNEQNRVCGITDISLSGEGIRQAEELARTVQKRKIDQIISSPLNRAAETSRIVASLCHIPFITDGRLTEQNYGIYEGVNRQNPSFLKNKRNFACKYPQGESMMQTACRIYGFIDELKENGGDKSLLLITHGGVCRIIRTYFTDMTNDEFFEYTLGNGELEEYDL